MTYRNIAAAMAAFACLPAAAHAETRDPVTAKVSLAGIDLNSVEGRRIFDARLIRAARHACVSRAAGFRAIRDSQQCEAEMRRDADVRVAALTRRQPVEVASRTTR